MTLWFAAWHSTTEPHQPGLLFVFNESCFIELVFFGGLEVRHLVFVISEVILNTRLSIFHDTLLFHIFHFGGK